MGKAETYAEALMPDDDRPGDAAIDVYCIVGATRRLCRSKRVDGEEPRLPSAPVFREMCLEEWHRLYRMVGHELVNPDGYRVLVTRKVRRDTPAHQVERILADLKSGAIAAGMTEVPAALPETTEPVQPAFKPVPRERRETEADHAAKRALIDQQIQELRPVQP